MSKKLSIASIASAIFLAVGLVAIMSTSAGAVASPTTEVTPPPSCVVPSATPANARFAAGGLTLVSGCTPAGPVEAVFQADGNFVVYNLFGGHNAVLWQSGTAGAATGGWLSIQKDGNLAIYSATGTAVWSTGTRFVGGGDGEGGYVRMQQDGNLVLYGNQGSAVVPVWSTGTAGK